MELEVLPAGGSLGSAIRFLITANGVDVRDDFHDSAGCVCFPSSTNMLVWPEYVDGTITRPP